MGKALFDGKGDRDRAMKVAANQTPSFDFSIDESSKTLIISSANLKKVKVNFYSMRSEILFSNSPFLSNKEKIYVSPNEAAEIELEESNTTTVQIPQSLKN